MTPEGLRSYHDHGECGGEEACCYCRPIALGEPRVGRRVLAVEDERPALRGSALAAMALLAAGPTPVVYGARPAPAGMDRAQRRRRAKAQRARRARKAQRRRSR
jgi:hypothetical protein